MITRRSRWEFVERNWTRFSEMTFQPPAPPSRCDGTAAETEGMVQKNIVFLMIPGNPGNDLYYEKFGHCLLEKVGSRINQTVRFFAVSHLNHVDFFSSDACTREHAREDTERFDPMKQALFLLDDQVKHKMDFCRKFMHDLIGTEHKLYVIGHSIGAYIALRILPELSDGGWNVVDCYGLFPTLEQMADTPNGRWVTKTTAWMVKHDWAVRCAIGWLQFVPDAFKRAVLRLWLGFSVPKCVVDATVELSQPLVLRNIAHMANNEMQRVREFDPVLLEANRNCVVLYYGTKDGWCPMEMAETMRQRLPETGRVIVDEHGCEHAFVLHHSERMATIVAQLILDLE